MIPDGLEFGRNTVEMEGMPLSHLLLQKITKKESHNSDSRKPRMNGFYLIEAGFELSPSDFALQHHKAWIWPEYHCAMLPIC